MGKVMRIEWAQRLRGVRRIAVAALAVACGPAPLAGCGYQLIGSAVSVPGHIRSLHVGPFENQTREFGLQERLAFALEREFFRRGALRVESDPAAADAVLRGTIRDFEARPVAFDADDEALQYEVRMDVECVLERRDDGEVLWRAKMVRGIDEYSVRTDTVVPSSSQFQRGKIEFAALDDLTSIQLAETEKVLAVNRLLAAVVRDVYDRLLDDF
jgi:hypothetical protein